MARAERIYTQPEAAERLGVSVRTVQTYVQDGHLASVRIHIKGRRFRVGYRASELDRFERAQQRVSA